MLIFMHFSPIPHENQMALQYFGLLTLNENITAIKMKQIRLFILVQTVHHDMCAQVYLHSPLPHENVHALYSCSEYN